MRRPGRPWFAAPLALAAAVSCGGDTSGFVPIDAGVEGTSGDSSLPSMTGQGGRSGAALDADVPESMVPPGSGGAGGDTGTGGVAGHADGSAGAAPGGAGGGGGSAAGARDAGAPASSACGAAGVNAWIAENFAAVPKMTGAFDTRTTVEMPRLVHDATGTNAKYAFFMRDDESPNDPRVAFVNVRVTNLVSTDAFGGGIATSNSFPGVKMYMSNVYIEPNWPKWKSYESTNYDGVVLDGSEETYVECLTVKNWNADSALDIKSKKIQFDRLVTEGDGNRTLRFWGTGPHYLVKSSVNNGTGSVIWISNCADTVIRIYDSTFNGSRTVPADKVDCESGANPKFEYLDKDPRTTGEMHPMFTGR